MALWGVPRTPVDSLRRPRLSEPLESVTAAVTLLAPAGLGKTVALAEWARDTAATGLWVRVRDRDVDGRAFVQHLADELIASGLSPADGPLRHLGEAVSAGTDPWELLRRALRDLGECVLVVDDVDRLTPPAVEGLIAQLHELPALRLRATARSRTALTEPGLAVTLDALVLGADELALTRDEAHSILGAQADEATLDEVLASGGSPLIARALAQPPASAPPAAAGAAAAATTAPARSRGRASDAFADLLARRIATEQWESRLVNFLARTSVADELTLELASTLSGENADEAERMLDRAEREGLGLRTGSPATGARFRYAPLMREAFERLLRAEHPREVRALELATARWEAGNGYFYRALVRAREQEDWVLATAIVREGWHVLLRNHGSQVRELFSHVSVLTLRKLPLVTMMLAIIYNARRSNRLRALEFFALASYGASRQASSASPPDRALLAGVQAAALRVSGRMPQALVAADRCYDTLRSMSAADHELLGPNEPSLWNQAGTTFLYNGRTELALDSFARSTAVSDTRGLTAGILALGMTAGVHAIAGDLPEAATTVDEASQRDWPEGWLDGYSGSFYQIARAFIALEAFDLDEADRRVRILDPHRETIEHWSLLAHLDTVIELLRGNAGEALHRLQSTVRAQHRRRNASAFSTERLRHTFVLAHLANEDAPAAARALGPAHSGSGRGSAVADPRLTVSRARIALARGLPDEALALLGPDTGSGGSSRSRAESLLLATAALAQAGDDEQTVRAARSALAFAADRRQQLALAFVPRPALTELAAVLRRTDAPDLAATVSAVLGRAFIEGAQSDIRLTPRELEVAQRLGSGAPLTEIAAQLSVSPNTVKSQLRSLYRKLEVGSRAEAVTRLTVLGITSATEWTSRPAPRDE